MFNSRIIIKRIESWTVGTWFSYIQRSYITKNGSKSDVSNLPVAKRQNIPHTKKRTLKRKRKNNGNNKNMRKLMEKKEKEEVEPLPPLSPPRVTTTATITPPRLRFIAQTPRHNLMIANFPEMGTAQTPRHNLMITTFPERDTAKVRNVRKGTAKKGKASKRKEIQQVGEVFNAAFSPPVLKSPHHHCAYTDCHLDGRMFFK